jgi:hypothetical protein
MNRYFNAPIAPGWTYHETIHEPGLGGPGPESMSHGESCRCLEETPYRRRFKVHMRDGLGPPYTVEATHVQPAKALPGGIAFWDYDLKVEVAWVPSENVAFITTERI